MFSRLSILLLLVTNVWPESMTGASTPSLTDDAMAAPRPHSDEIELVFPDRPLSWCDVLNVVDCWQWEAEHSQRTTTAHQALEALLGLFVTDACHTLGYRFCG
jgi:hypothetical protein